MRIALIGYGKMGHMIEEVCLERGHEIVLKIHADNTEEFTQENLSCADVAIEFTGPHSAFANVTSCFDYGISVVSGSTGWNAKLEDAKRFAGEKGLAFLHANNLFTSSSIHRCVAAGL